jgi:hypothetical protein
MEHKVTTHDVSGVDNPEVGHETRDVNVRVIVGFGVSLIVAAIIIHLFVWVLFDLFAGLNARAYPRQYPTSAGSQVPLPPAPRLQDKPREDLKAMRRQEDELLNGYTWIDRSTGAVRIPIARAMKQVVEQGFPVDAEAAAPEPGPPQGSSSGRTTEHASKR